jgi:hypothetical protein
MSAAFEPGSDCFMNRNFALFPKYDRGRFPLAAEESRALLKDVTFGPPGRFMRILYGEGGKPA